MKNKIFSFALASCMALMLAVSGITIASAEDTTTYPGGCTSSSGYSSTTGTSCAGTSVVGSSSVAGCANSLGFSSSNGSPCSGTETAQYLAGCQSSTFGYSSTTGSPCSGSGSATAFMPGCSNSMFGYSSTSGSPCNGTSVATPWPTAIPVIPVGGVYPIPSYTAWQSLIGCRSVLGYSASGVPCNGTTNAFIIVFS